MFVNSVSAYVGFGITALTVHSEYADSDLPSRVKCSMICHNFHYPESLIRAEFRKTVLEHSKKIESAPSVQENVVNS